jgi:hypothetical protein
MTDSAFIDTNVLLYAASNAAADQSKRQIARQVLSQPGIAFSAQVLQEFYVAAVTKQRLKMSHDEALAVRQSITGFPVEAISRELILAAIEIKTDIRFRTGMQRYRRGKAVRLRYRILRRLRVRRRVRWRPSCKSIPRGRNGTFAVIEPKWERKCVRKNVPFIPDAFFSPGVEDGRCRLDLRTIRSTKC